MSNKEEKYDAFLIYSFSDVEWVELIAQKISDSGANVWFDRWSLVVGQEWKLKLENALSNSYAILIFIGPNSISKSQKLELYAGLDRKKKIIPILLPGCNWSKVLSLFKDLNFIDLRLSLQNQGEIDRLITLIKQNHIDNDIYKNAWVDLENGNYEAAREKLQKILNIPHELDNEQSAALIFYSLGKIDLLQSDFYSAREKFEKAMEMMQHIGDKAGEAAAWHQLGTIDLNTGDYDLAREKFEKAMEMMQHIGDKAGEAAAWHQLGTIDLNQGDYDSARKKLEQSIAIKQQIGDRSSEAATWHALATIELRRGDYDSARKKF
jgi:tetratricopeptide (TPR) repeat protein